MATHEERLRRQLAFISNRLNEISVTPATKARVLRLIEADLRKKLEKLGEQTQSPAFNATPQDHGKCLICDREAELVDGYLCEDCFQRQAKT